MTPFLNPSNSSYLTPEIRTLTDNMETLFCPVGVCIKGGCKKHFRDTLNEVNIPPLLAPHLQIRGNRDLVGFLFNDFFLLVKPKNFFSRAATPTELEPFGKNEFVMYRTVSPSLLLTLC